MRPILRCWDPIVRDSLLPVTFSLVLGALGCVRPPGALEGQQGAVLDVCAIAAEGALCDDKNVCTVFDVCKAGVCTGSPAPNGTLCTDGNVCTANDSCRVGVCKGDSVPDATACTDGDPCTVGDACKAGLCLSGAGVMLCNDGISCTFDICVGGVGCVFSPVGDCAVPKDAGSDVVDAKTDTGSSDTTMMMTGGDGPTDKATPVDTAPVIDAPKDMTTTGPEVGPTDTMPPVDVAKPDATPPPPDAPIDMAMPPPDAPVDMAMPPPDAPVVVDLGMVVDATTPQDATEDGSDAKPDAKADAASDGAVVVPTIPPWRASGGACSCAVAEPPGGGLGVTLVAAVAVALGRRRRRGRL
jgi:MYXO-CTERM domain-containing protein